MLSHHIPVPVGSQVWIIKFFIILWKIIHLKYHFFAKPIKFAVVIGAFSVSKNISNWPFVVFTKATMSQSFNCLFVSISFEFKL